MPINYKEYPTDWKETRERILERSNHCCEFCGIKNHIVVHKETREEIDSELKAFLHQQKELHDNISYAHKCLDLTKIVLTIAHLDHDKSNHEVSDDRLAALCQKCHLQYDMPRHVNNRKYGRNHEKNQGKLF